MPDHKRVAPGSLQNMQKKRSMAMRLLALAAAALALGADMAGAAPAQQPYRSFGVAIYIPVASTRQLADPKVLQQQFERIWSQVHFNKVYLEDYRSGVFADPASLDRIARFFRARGIAVDGGLTLTAVDQGGPFQSFDYESPKDVAMAERAVRMAASHFDTVILDDFTFYNTRSDADIRAKGSLSWTQYRLNKMRWVAQHVILGTARAANPHVKVIIKYPNWYEHFQGLGFDLDREAQLFDYIYTGTETRDPVATYQLLQQYESYLDLPLLRQHPPARRRPRRLGGYVRDALRRPLCGAALGHDVLQGAGDHPLQLDAARFRRRQPSPASGHGPVITPASTGTRCSSPSRRRRGARRWRDGRASPAMRSSRSMAIVGKLGAPIGIESYKPYQSSSDEDFLQNYLGNIGFPIDLTPRFPKGAPVTLLTRDAAFDPNLVQEIEGNLEAGGDVIITSGLLQALGHKGIENVAEISYSGLPIAARHYYGTFGPHGGGDLDVAGRKNPTVIFPQIHFYTNDSWPLIRGEAAANAVPILLATQYGPGQLYVLDVPANMGQLLELPQPVLDDLRGWLTARFPLRIDAPALREPLRLRQPHPGRRVVPRQSGHGACVRQGHRLESGRPRFRTERAAGARGRPGASPRGSGRDQLRGAAGTALVPGFPGPMTKPARRTRSKVRVGATIKDVARQAGVSPMTVSRVVNGSSYVSSTTRSAVQHAVRQLGYSPNIAARNLASERGERLGLLYGNPSSAYLSEFLVGALESATRHGVQLVLEKCEPTPVASRKAVRRLLSGGVVGVVLPPPLCESSVLRTELSAARLPVVTVASGRPAADTMCVRIDDYSAALEMTRYLIGLGHERLAFIKGHPNQSASEERWLGFTAAMEEVARERRARPAPRMEQGFFSFRSGLDAARKLLAVDPVPTAIFASNDDMAAAVVAEAHRRGLDVPRDLTVVGFDDTLIASTIWPELTTIQQPIARMAAEAVDMLVTAVRGGRRAADRLHRLIPHALISRQSAAAPKLAAGLPPVREWAGHIDEGV